MNAATWALALIAAGCSVSTESTDEGAGDHAPPPEQAELPDGVTRDDGYIDPCTIGFVVNDHGEIINVPTECASGLQVDKGDPERDWQDGVDQPPQP